MYKVRYLNNVTWPGPGNDIHKKNTDSVTIDQKNCGILGAQFLQILQVKKSMCF